MIYLFAVFSRGIKSLASTADILIGGFRVLERLKSGSGSQGVVYKAVCEEEREGIAERGEVVAIKVMTGAQGDGGRQWRSLEKRTRELARLRHPNVVRYRGCFSIRGLYNDTYVIVEEFLSGETLKEHLARNPGGLDVEEGMRIVMSVVEGLAYVASCGIVHRDVKPGNVFLCLSASGAIRAVKLIDFEIAGCKGDARSSSVSNNMLGSFDYMAPEFTSPDFVGDVQSDVFSMGVVIHETLTGKLPYRSVDGGTKQPSFAFLSRWGRKGGQDVDPICVSPQVRRVLSRADTVIVKALSRVRSVRYPSFIALREALWSVRFRELRNGDTVYRLLRFVGKGGFGEVFKARNKRTGEMVAIKHLLKAGDAVRFRREANVMRKLNYEDGCFVRFIDFFELTGVAGAKEAFLVMAYMDGMPGSSLRDALRAAKGRGLPTRDVFTAFSRYAHGLGVMHRHEKGIFHRDIKPSNLYYPARHPEFAAIMDFGIVREESGTMTAGLVPGTLDYMPPEVVTKENNRGDAGMDMYALGLCLYEALTGKMGYPRLPSGPAGYSEFLNRATTRRPPVFDDPLVVANKPLMILLRRMTDPDDHRRLKDAFAAADLLAEMSIGAVVPVSSVERCTATPSGNLSTPAAASAIRSKGDGMSTWSIPGGRGKMIGLGAVAFLIVGLGVWKYIEQRREIVRLRKEIAVLEANRKSDNDRDEEISLYGSSADERRVQE